MSELDETTAFGLRLLRDYGPDIRYPLKLGRWRDYNMRCDWPTQSEWPGGARAIFDGLALTFDGGYGA